MKKILLICLFYFSANYCADAMSYKFEDPNAEKLFSLISNKNYDEAIKLIQGSFSINFSMSVSENINMEGVFHNTTLKFSILKYIIHNSLSTNKILDNEIELFNLLIDRNKFADKLECYKHLQQFLPDFIKNCFNLPYAYVKFLVDIFKRLKQKLKEDIVATKVGENLKNNNFDELNCLVPELKTIITDYLIIKDIPSDLITELFPNVNDVLANYSVVESFFSEVECGPDGIAKPDKLWHEAPSFFEEKNKGCCTIQ